MTTPPSPCGTLRRGVADLARLLLEDRADQLLLGRQLGLALRRDLADEQVARADLGADRGRRRARRGCASDSSERFGMSRVISSSPSFVERASISYSWMWIEERMSSLTRRSREDDRVLEVVALEGMKATSRFAPSASSPLSVELPSARTVARLHLVAQAHDRLVVDERALVRAHELRQRVLVAPALRLDDDLLGVDVGDGAGAPRETTTSPESTAARYSRPVPTSGAWRDQQRHGLPLHVRAHQRAVRVVVLEERDQRGRDRARSAPERRP